MQEYYSTSETANIFNVTAKTMRNWDKEDFFIPSKRDGEERLYSRQQIELKLGKTIEEAIDPILQLKKDDINYLISICENKSEIYTNGFNPEDKDISFVNNNLKERFQFLYVKIIEKSTYIFRKTDISGANWLLTSPEMASWFEICTAGFAAAPHKEEKSSVKYSGLINCRWRLYSSTLLDPGDLLLGIKLKSEIIKTTDALAMLVIKDWTL